MDNSNPILRPRFPSRSASRQAAPYDSYRHHFDWVVETWFYLVTDGSHQLSLRGATAEALNLLAYEAAL